MQELSENLRLVIDEIVEKKIISLEELKPRIFKCIKELSENEALHVLDNFLSSDLSGVENKESYLYDSFLDHLKSSETTQPEIKILSENVTDISDKQKVLDLLKKTSYTLNISFGQRRYGGPPPHWEGPPPGTGGIKFFSQVHIGKLHKYTFEDVLVPALESCGRVWQLRIMTDPSTGEGKGFAFADFFTNDEALKFVEKYNGQPLGESPGITARLTSPNTRLFIGGIPTTYSKDVVENEISRLFPSSFDIKVFTGKFNPNRNRGFAFLSFTTHDEANRARKGLNSGKFLIFGMMVRNVDWADHKEVEDTPVLKPKTIHIKCSQKNLSEDYLRKIFSEFGEIVSVKTGSDYSFVEFESEESAQGALLIMNNKKMDDLTFQVFPAHSFSSSKRKKKSVHLKNKSIGSLKKSKLRNFPSPNSPKYHLEFHHGNESYHPFSSHKIPDYRHTRTRFPDPSEFFADRDLSNPSSKSRHYHETKTHFKDLQENPKSIDWGHSVMSYPQQEYYKFQQVPLDRPKLSHNYVSSYQRYPENLSLRTVNPRMPPDSFLFPQKNIKSFQRIYRPPKNI